MLFLLIIIIFLRFRFPAQFKETLALFDKKVQSTIPDKPLVKESFEILKPWQSENFRSYTVELCKKSGVSSSLMIAILESKPISNHSELTKLPSYALADDPYTEVELAITRLKNSIVLFPDDLKKALGTYLLSSEEIRSYDGVPPNSEILAFIDEVMEKLNKE